MKEYELNTVTLPSSCEERLDYLSDMVAECCFDSIYNLSKADIRRIKTLMSYYGEHVDRIQFVKAMWPGNKCLAVYLASGDTVTVEY